MPRVTVCIPTYNRQRYLREALDSVFRQTWTDFEVLVVDDGSTDGTAKTLRSYPHPIRYIYQENQGVAAACNRLIAETRTPLVAWLGSDDLWLPEKLEKQMALLEGKPERTIIYNPMMTIDAKGNMRRRQGRPSPSGRITTLLFEHTFVPTISALMPTHLVSEVGGFDRRYRVCSDYRLLLMLSLSCDFAAYPKPLVMNRRHDTNLSANSFANQSMKIAMLEEFYYELGGKAVIPRDTAMRRLSRECRKAADFARQEKKRQEARLFAQKALGYQATPRTAIAYLAVRLGV